MKYAHPPAQSLAQRLSRALTSVVFSVWVLGTALVAWYVDYKVQENFDVELVESAHRQLYPALLDIQLQHPQLSIPAALAHVSTSLAQHDPQVMGELPGSDHSEPLLLQLRSATGQVLLRTKATPASPLSAPLQPGFFDTDDYRVFTMYDAQYQVWLQLADPLDERLATSQSIATGLGVVLLVMLPLMAWLITWVARRQLQSVANLQRQITSRSSSNLQPLVVDDMPSELQAVGEGVNQLLARLGEALNIERALAANAAHELRTPLAEVRLRLHTAVEQARAGGVAATDIHGVPLPEVRMALASLETLSHRTERLLQLSRAEGGDRASFAPVNLVQLAEQVAQEFWQKIGVQKRLDCLTPETQDAVWVWGDMDGLAIVLRNLIENALRHTKGAVELQVLAQPHAALLVRDAGPGLSPLELQKIQQRHARLESQHIGYGLGMSIVQTIAQKHGAALEFTSPPPAHAQGLQVALQFAHSAPAAAQLKPLPCA
jgi:two-component system, OmpR family, sensor kinase